MKPEEIALLNKMQRDVNDITKAVDRLFKDQAKQLRRYEMALEIATLSTGKSSQFFLSKADEYIRGE